MERVIAILLAWSLCCGAGEIAILNLRVLEGEGTVYGIGSRATRGITLEVTDETGRPVSDVAISFRLPEEGASGTFSNGTRTEIVTTRQDGRASVWGMKWNRVEGTVAVRITASKDGVRAGVVSTQYLTNQPVASVGRLAGSGHSKLLLISLAVAGAAGSGIAFGLARSPKSTSTVPAVVPISIGTPSVIVGAP